MRKTRELLEPFLKEDPKRDPKELFFRCPECGCSELSQIMTGVRLIRDVDRVYEGGTVKLGEWFDEEVDDIFYACAACEFRLHDDAGYSVGMDDDLAKWLQENCKEDLPSSE
ncbi:MAG: hypothetical protein ACLP5H_14215 [Desulfomonilaceae bacterium]